MPHYSGKQKFTKSYQYNERKMLMLYHIDVILCKVLVNLYTFLLIFIQILQPLLYDGWYCLYYQYLGKIILQDLHSEEWVSIFYWNLLTVLVTCYSVTGNLICCIYYYAYSTEDIFISSFRILENSIRDFDVKFYTHL